MQTDHLYGFDGKMAIRCRWTGTNADRNGLSTNSRSIAVFSSLTRTAVRSHTYSGNGKNYHSPRSPPTEELLILFSQSCPRPSRSRSPEEHFRQFRVTSFPPSKRPLQHTVQIPDSRTQ